MTTRDAPANSDDERPVDQDGELVLPNRLHAPLEADVLEQAIEVRPGARQRGLTATQSRCRRVVAPVLGTAA